MVQFFRDSLFCAGESLRVGSGERLRERSDCTSTLGRTAEKMIFNPLHYLALLEQKTNALDQAAALEGWQLPEDFLELRREMEERLGKRGRREYVQVLRLLETFSLPKVAAAVRQALHFPIIAFDAVKNLLLCAIERRAPKLDLENYPHLLFCASCITSFDHGGSSADACR
jgi:hypothetical protein